SNGDLIHAELGALTGEAAAAQILAWDDGEFKSCERPLGAVTIHSSLQALLLRLARDSDEAAALSERGSSLESLHVADADRPTERHLPAPSPDGSMRAGPLMPPRPGRTPPPLPPRFEREPPSRDFAREAITQVLISPSGELLQGRGV